MRNLLKNYYLLFDLLLAVIAGMITIHWSYINHYNVAYNDAKAHLNIARRVIDNLNPGLAQLGGVWLPFPHLLMLPFVMNNFLYRSGLAGTIISFVSYLISATFIFKSIFRLSKSYLASLIGTVVFVLNPNVLYMQTTPMGELPTLALLSLCMYFFILWIQEKKLNVLISLGFIMLLGSLTRYEFWYLNIFTIIAVPLVFFDDKKGVKFKYKTIEGVGLFLSYISLFGIGLWLLWNKLIFNDFLYFINSAFSAGGYQKQLIAQGLNLPYHNVLQAFIFYLHAVADNSSWIVVVTSMIGLLIYILRNRNWSGLSLLLFSLSIFIFEVLSLYSGNSTIYVQELYPYDLYNIRYGLFVLPFIALFAGYLIAVSKKLLKYPVSLLVIVVIVFQVIKFQPVTFLDVSKSTKGPILGDRNAQYVGESKTGNFLSKYYQGGYVLASAGVSDPIIFNSNIDIKNFITEGNQQYWSTSLRNPAKYASWIVVQNNIHDIRNRLGVSLYNNKTLANKFDLVFFISDKEVYKKKGVQPNLQILPLTRSRIFSKQFLANNHLIAGITTGQAVASKTYTVQAGDSLWKIAQKEYGDPYKWVNIAKKNNLVNPDLIFAGNVLKI
jgi:hypothetical protein